MPKTPLNMSHTMTIGAKLLASLETPNGCRKKRRARMPQDAPTIVEFEMPGETTSILPDISGEIY